MDDAATETSTDAEASTDGGPAVARASHFGRPSRSIDRAPRARRRWLVPAVLGPLVLLGLLVIGWAVDTSSGGVGRNVELAGVEIGGLSEDELAGRVGEVAADFSATPVELVVGSKVYETTADEIGLTVDQELTAESALEVGESSFAPARPFAWALSLVTDRQAPLRLQVNSEQVATQVVALEGEDRTPATEPTVEVGSPGTELEFAL